MKDTNNARQYTRLDHLINGADQALRTVFGNPPTTERDDPAVDVQKSHLNAKQRRHSAGLMRVNHVGEVCAQALYQGQALTARDSKVRDAMSRAADEENDHLLWCRERVQELGSHTSYLNPIWYLGSLSLGLIAGAAGDKWSLGFVAETERQVVKHLDKHYSELPEQDNKSRAVVAQMKIDEAKHASMAVASGAAELPVPVKQAMRLMSKIMTTTAYYI